MPTTTENKLTIFLDKVLITLELEMPLQTMFSWYPTPITLEFHGSTPNIWQTMKPSGLTMMWGWTSQLPLLQPHHSCLTPSQGTHLTISKEQKNFWLTGALSPIIQHSMLWSMLRITEARRRLEQSHWVSGHKWNRTRTSLIWTPLNGLKGLKT